MLSRRRDGHEQAGLGDVLLLAAPLRARLVATAVRPLLHRLVYLRVVVWDVTTSAPVESTHPTRSNRQERKTHPHLWYQSPLPSCHEYCVVVISGSHHHRFFANSSCTSSFGLSASIRLSALSCVCCSVRCSSLSLPNSRSTMWPRLTLILVPAYVASVSPPLGASVCPLSRPGAPSVAQPVRCRDSSSNVIPHYAFAASRTIHRRRISIMQCLRLFGTAPPPTSTAQGESDEDE